MIVCPTSAVLDCDPEIRAGTANYFDLRNKKKLRNFITAEITGKGYFKFYVENLPQTTPQTGCPGKWLFRVAWDHFIAEGMTPCGIRGEWTFGDNLNVVNQLTANNAMTLEEAAIMTWSGFRASEKGFTTVVVLNQDGTPGNYISIDVVFLP